LNKEHTKFNKGIYNHQRWSKIIKWTFCK